jgi:hypothetical protein
MNPLRFIDTTYSLLLQSIPCQEEPPPVKLGVPVLVFPSFLSFFAVFFILGILLSPLNGIALLGLLRFSSLLLFVFCIAKVSEVLVTTREGLRGYLCFASPVHMGITRHVMCEVSDSRRSPESLPRGQFQQR